MRTWSHLRGVKNNTGGSPKTAWALISSHHNDEEHFAKVCSKSFSKVSNLYVFGFRVKLLKLCKEKNQDQTWGIFLNSWGKVNSKNENNLSLLKWMALLTNITTHTSLILESTALSRSQFFFCLVFCFIHTNTGRDRRKMKGSSFCSWPTLMCQALPQTLAWNHHNSLKKTPKPVHKSWKIIKT